MHKDWKEVKLALFIHEMIVYVKELIVMRSEFWIVTRYANENYIKLAKNNKKKFKCHMQ